MSVLDAILRSRGEHEVDIALRTLNTGNSKEKRDELLVGLAVRAIFRDASLAGLGVFTGLIACAYLEGNNPCTMFIGVVGSIVCASFNCALYINDDEGQ